MVVGVAVGHASLDESVEHSGARIAEHELAGAGRHLQVKAAREERPLMHVQEVESAAVMQVDPGLQVKCALPLTHLAERTGARYTNSMSQGGEVGSLQHAHILTVPTLTIGSTCRPETGRTHREYVLHPSIQMRDERVQMCLPDPRREKIE